MRRCDEGRRSTYDRAASVLLAHPHAMSDSTPARLLIADDQPDVLEALRLLLVYENFSLQLVTTPAALIDQLGRGRWDAVLMDLNYTRDTTSGEEGLQLVTRIRAEHRELPIVVMTAWGNIELAVAAMRAGAQSFVQKPWDNRALIQVLEREVREGRDARARSDRHAMEQRDAFMIQRALMPATLPATDHFEVVGAWHPAGTLGGDTYDAFRFAPEVIGLSIADIAGKGLPAALLMSSLQSAVRAFALDAALPETVCASVNRLLCGQMIAGRFATHVYLRLDAGRGELAYANAGHNPPLLGRANGEVVPLGASGTVLGVFPEAEYRSASLPLRPGDRLVLYTDGITEARNPDGDEFGQERLTSALVRHRHLEAGPLHAALMDEVRGFAIGGFDDDATLVVAAVR
jgi:sigma-B regulation protein RsbU (phosphoserine phosphatase)